MEKILQPRKLSIDPNGSGAATEWRHWKCTFLGYANKYITAVTSDNVDRDRLLALVGCATPEVYEYFDHCETYNEAEALLEKLYVKKPNAIFARHVLQREKQKPNQTLEDFRCTLLKLAKDCEFRDVTAMQYKDDMVRDSFINGIASPEIRQRLLEHKQLTMTEAFQQAVTLDNAKRDNQLFGYKPAVQSVSEAVNSIDLSQEKAEELPMSTSAALMGKFTCHKCGSSRPHDFKGCKARNQVCFKCNVKGHYGRVCHLQKKGFLTTQDRKVKKYSAAVTEDAYVLCHAEQLGAANDVISNSLNYAMIHVKIKEQVFEALLDTGSSKNFIDESVAMRYGVKKVPITFNVGMAQRTNVCKVTGVCHLKLNVLGNEYSNVELYVMENLCVDILLGRQFLQSHKRIIFELGGERDELVVAAEENLCAVASSKVSTPSLFANLRPGWEPIRTKSRRFNELEKQYIEQKVAEWKKAGTIRPSRSPWRAQCVVVKQNGQFARLAIDYSQTINLFTEKDGFPIPLIEEIVNKVASFKYFASYDLKRAYHQIPIPESDKPYTAFEAGGELLEFNVIPFGVTNGGPIFQRIMSKIIVDDKLKNTMVYFDNVILGAMTLAELKLQSTKFQEAMVKRGMTLNDSKTIYGVEELNILGYCVSSGKIRPDPERLTPLWDLPPPSTSKSLQRVLGLFAYYAKWIPKFSDRIERLKSVKHFPLKDKELSDFKGLKESIASATLQAIDESVPFTVECDASDVAVSATLNQNGRPVAFMSRSLQGSELVYPAVEKEATAIIEAVRKWSHLLMRQHFYLITDQRSVAFMLDSRKKTKIKNNKIMCWRLELACFSYSIRYRPGNKNVGPDTLTRAFCATISKSESKLDILHKQLCCPGVTRLWHFVRAKNLPYSLDDVKKCCEKCITCAEVKPHFYKPENNCLIKATQPMERLNIDFKGPLPSSSKNIYFLCIVDEFSRFPFIFPCPNMSAATIIGCLERVFALFGTCGYIHSDRGTALMSRQLKDFLLQKGIATSRTTPYNPQGNGQCERYNGIVWRAIKCALKSRMLPIHSWEMVLPEALNSIRSLLCTSTNETPHSRFIHFTRRSQHGRSLPDWLCKPGPVLLRKFAKTSKHDDITRKVDLVEANPMYARIRYPDGRESNVSLKDLARCPNIPDYPELMLDEEETTRPGDESPKSLDDSKNLEDGENVCHKDITESGETVSDSPIEQELEEFSVWPSHGESSQVPAPRRSDRVNKGVPPARYGDLVQQ